MMMGCLARWSRRWICPDYGMVVERTAHRSRASFRSGTRTTALSLYYCDVYVVKLPENHRFPMKKYAATRKRIESTLSTAMDASGQPKFSLIRRNRLTSVEDGPSLVQEIQRYNRKDSSVAPRRRRQEEHAALDVVLTPSAFLSQEQAELVHESGYIQRFLTGSLRREEEKAVGFPWSRDLVRRTLASSLGTAQAAFDALETGFGAQIAGGTHHAFYDYGEGFCTFNDIAVAASMLLRWRSQQVKKILVIDLDVHQGNGTAKMFESDDRVYTFSMHCGSNLFSTKQFGNRDVEIREGSGYVLMKPDEVFQHY
eukprot:gb/GECG01012618.1/.p1 GENE.gb/GECG01012618.1/~~gb/GECG01012618.1/.p1  ORF type:complete len:312 (+),score=32.93 gb/GECG01012618.1/:1-936(+)